MNKLDDLFHPAFLALVGHDPSSEVQNYFCSKEFLIPKSARMTLMDIYTLHFPELLADSILTKLVYSETKARVFSWSMCKS